MERLIVKNFAGIKEAELEFRDITVLIGPQAEGKSVIASLLFIMREARKWLEIKEVYSILQNVLNEFIEFRKIPFNFSYNELDIRAVVHDLLNVYMHTSAWSSKGDTNIKFHIDKISKIRGKTEIIISDIKDIKIIKNEDFNKSILEFASPLLGIISGIILPLKMINEHPEKIKMLSSVIDNIKLYGKNAGYELPKDKIKLDVQIAEKLISSLIEISIQSLWKASESVLNFQHIFIPANRSIYALVQRMPELWERASVDPMFIDFGIHYEQVKRWWLNEGINNKNLRSVMGEFIGGELVETSLGEAIKHPDGRVVDMVMVSSGQKEILPLVLTLLWLRERKDKHITVALYIEEPEAHLFPETQKKLVNLIAEVYNALKGRLRLVITTHSPYIITALNNLLYAGYIRDKFKDRKDVAAKLEKALRRQEDIPSLGSRIISPSKVAVYEVKRSGTRSILDENGLISDSYMDEIADELYREEEELYEIKWEVEHGSERYLGQ